MKSLVERLTQTFAPSGYEEAIRAVIWEEIAASVDEVRVDRLGNLIARKGTKREGGVRILVAAHMDEIGLIATHIEEKGYVRFTSVGGVWVHTLIGGRVRFLNGTPGVIHVDQDEDLDHLPAMDKLFIDVGATSAADCPLRVGDIAAFERPFLEMGRRWVAKSMDDRIGVAVMIEALRTLKETPNEVYFVFTVQEEIGTRGAAPAAFALEPDLALAVDVTNTGDRPGGKMAVALGKGPAIKIRDGGMIADPKVVQWMVETAERAGIPYQREVLLGGTTDARAIQLARAGVPSGCLSIPCRYLHSPSEMVDAEDVQNAIRLLVNLLASPLSIP
ncbi:MAG: M42 family metallopeptidase [Anaerolineales bacterium]